jgi:hypothetical protein
LKKRAAARKKKGVLKTFFFFGRKMPRRLAVTYRQCQQGTQLISFGNSEQKRSMFIDLIVACRETVVRCTVRSQLVLHDASGGESRESAALMILLITVMLFFA